MNNNIVLEVKNLNFKYKKDGFSLKNINFKMEKSSILGLIGKNGCGKTTLLQILQGFLIQESGEIILDNKDISNDIIQIRDISYIFQKPFLYPHLTIYQNLLMGLNGFGLKEEEIDLRVKKILGVTKMLPYANVKPNQISEGQKQIISVSKAILREPSLLLMDEPFSNLDEKSKQTCIKLIKKVNEKFNTSIIFVSHSFNDVSNLCSDVLIFEDGEVIFNGKTLDCILSKDEKIQSLIKE